MARRYTNQCERCRKVKPLVVGAAFNGDGSFRMLCPPCTAAEEWQNQRRLFKESRRVLVMPEPEEIEPEPEIQEQPQMSLFG